MKRFFLRTFGCQMNAHDSRRIAEILGSHDYRATDNPKNADVIIFNTCSVRDKAEHKLISAVGALRPLKNKHRNRIIAIAGCVAQQYSEALLKKIDFIDLVVGPDNIEQLPHLIAQVEKSGRPVVQTVFDLERPRFLRAKAQPRTSEVTAYVTVMKGCNERCAFCIVPSTRGTERYRPAKDIVEEIQQLVQDGIREVTLLGQTVNSWRDPDRKAGSEGADFAALLRCIAAEVPNLLRLRYTAPHPRYVTAELVRAHAELEVLPWHVHLPVQSGSDRVLKRMVRRYQRTTFIEKAQALLKARPGFTLSTDFIVGFPGETEQDFEQTLSLVREIGFVTAFAFKYSPRPGTAAIKLGDSVAEETKRLRLARLFELVEAQQLAHHDTLVGSKTQVLLEGPNAKQTNSYSGRSHRHEIVHVKVPQGRDLTGRLVEVVIEQAHQHSLIGSLTGSEITSLRSPKGVLVSPLDDLCNRTHSNEATV
jgi:tRNA-2-methylthio-N6-dimethylallyladenosine synthase